MKKLIYTIVTILLLSFLLVIIIGKFIVARNINVEEQRIYIEGLDKTYIGTKLVHFSDIHISCNSNLNYLNEIVSEIVEIEPDILVFGGDLTSSLCDADKNNEIIEALKPLSQIVWKFAILGDEDKETAAQHILKSNDFFILNNSSFVLYNKNIEGINLVGLNSSSSFNNSLLDDLENKYPTILFAHEPDLVINLNKNKVDVAFIAHTRLGEIFVPFYKGLLTVDGAETIGYKQYDVIDNLETYTSRGLGTKNIGIRLFNKPTIHFYRLDRK